MERKILKLFTFANKLKFNEIEKSLNTRSNKLAYHLKNLVNKGILIKNEETYSLSETSEDLIPYLSEKKSILPVILIRIGDNKKCFLYTRNKRPFKNFLSLPGGRPVLGESINDSVKRIMKEKFNIKARLSKIHSVSIEKLKKRKKVIQTDLIIFVSAKTKDNCRFIDIEKNKKKIITSDYILLSRDLDKKIDIKTINTTRL